MGEKMNFTIIELLMVVAIIMILASLLLPVLGKARSRAHRIKCLGNMKQIHYGTVNYQDENQEFICNGDIRGMVLGNLVGQYWHERIRYYANARKGQKTNEIFDCPAEPTPRNFPYTSYGLNCTFAGVAWWPGYWGNYMRKTAAVRRPSAVLHVAEAGGNAYRIDSANWWYFRHGSRYYPRTRDFELRRFGNGLYSLFRRTH